MANLVLDSSPLGFPWATVDPFLFCAYHNDAYPPGNGRMGPDSSLLEGRNLGMDFEVRDGFRMYHGHTVPGFPSHPHRGFETVTLVRKGFCDHSDSLGAAARFGAGDVQWLTTGGGIVHAEMFPLLEDNQDNPLELFQIWLNLPAKGKMVPAHFKLLWSQDIPKITRTDSSGKLAVITLIAGELDGVRAPSPPPHSWASAPENDVAIWTIDLEAGARTTLPPAAAGSRRALYFFEGDDLQIDGESFTGHRVFLVQPDMSLPLTAGATGSKLLMLQGRPINEPVAQHGPFVMNTRAELMQTMQDYQKTQFGGWPWPDQAPVHDKTGGRFARHPDGRVEEFPR